MRIIFDGGESARVQRARFGFYDSQASILQPLACSESRLFLAHSSPHSAHPHRRFTLLDDSFVSHSCAGQPCAMATLADRIAARKARKARREAEEAAASGRAAEPREPVAPPPAPPRERRRPSATAVPARRPSAAAVADRRDARSAPLPERVERLARATEGVDVSDSLRARIERRRRSSGRAEAPRACLLYTSPSPRDVEESRMPSSA